MTNRNLKDFVPAKAHASLSTGEVIKLLRELYLEGGVLFGYPLHGLTQLLLVRLGLGLYGHGYHRLGKTMDSSSMGR